MNFLEKAQSRKLILAVVAISIVGIFVDVSPQEKMDFSKWVLIGYFGANALGKIANGVGGGKK